MATCASKLQGKISALENVITNYWIEYWKLKNMLLEIGEEEGLTDEQWKVVEHRVVAKELLSGHCLITPEQIQQDKIDAKALQGKGEVKK